MKPSSIMAPLRGCGHNHK